MQTVVSAGTAHTAVRVTAAIASPALSTQSSNLTVTTGLPASGAFSIAVGAPSYATLACPNVEAYGIDLIHRPRHGAAGGSVQQPGARRHRRSRSPTNGGHIGGSCTTPLTNPGDGECQVTWTSANPRPGPPAAHPPTFSNGRAQILATAIGEESFDDVNSTGYYQAGDPFSDLGEPYLDANESGAYVKGDYFLDYYNTRRVSGPERQVHRHHLHGLFLQPTTLAIGVEHLLIMSTSKALVSSISTT